MSTRKSLLILKPYALQAWFNLGNLDRRASRFQEALSAFRAVLRLQPAHWKALLHMAVTLIALDRQEEAHTALKQAYQISGLSQIHIIACTEALTRWIEPECNQFGSMHLKRYCKGCNSLKFRHDVCSDILDLRQCFIATGSNPCSLQDFAAVYGLLKRLLIQCTLIDLT